MIERNISVTRESIIQPIAYVENTNMIPIVLHVTDYDLPEDAVARAYAGENGMTTILCDIKGNDILIPVVSGFFKINTKTLQIRIVKGDGTLLISFPIPVNVKKDMTGSDAEEPANNPGTMDQLVAKYGEIKGKVNKVENDTIDLQNQIGVLDQLKTQVKTSLVNALNWTVDRIGNISEKIGGTDISGIGDGTVTGAISALNSNLNNKANYCNGTRTLVGRFENGSFTDYTFEESGLYLFQCTSPSITDSCRVAISGINIYLTALGYQIIPIKKGVTIKIVGTTQYPVNVLKIG